MGEQKRKSFVDFLTDLPVKRTESSSDPLEQSKTDLWRRLRHRMDVVSFTEADSASSPYETLLHFVADYDPSGLCEIFELLIENRLMFPLLNPLNREHYLHLLPDICLPAVKNTQQISLGEDVSLGRIALLTCREWDKSQMKDFTQRLLWLRSFCRDHSLSDGTRPLCIDLGVGHIDDGSFGQRVLAACITDGETGAALNFAEQFADILIVEDVASDDGGGESFESRIRNSCNLFTDRKYCKIIVWKPSVSKFVQSEREANFGKRKLKFIHLSGSLSDQLLKFVTQQILQSYHQLERSDRKKLTSIDALDKERPVGGAKVLAKMMKDVTKMNKISLVNYFHDLLDEQDPLVRIMTIRRFEISLNWSSMSPDAKKPEELYVEHLWRELGHKYVENSEKYSKLPELAARHMLDGFSIELFDGQAFKLNVKWIEAVFQALHRFLNSMGNKMFVLSVIGVQSSGKSTLLNTMFGVKMRTGVGRCTRGINMQLVPVKGRKEYDYVLVLDSEGLRSPESNALQSYGGRDNQMATLGVLLADATILLNSGENDAAAKEILPVVMMACQRSSLAEENGSRFNNLLFFAYNKIDTNQKEKLGSIVRSLDSNLREAFEAVRRAGTHSKAKNTEASFFHRFRLYAPNMGSSSDVRVLGNCKMSYTPPDDVPDPSFGESVVEFREYIHERVTETGAWTSRTPLELASFVKGIWDCLCSTDFDLQFALFVEKIKFEEVEAEYQLCEQQIVAIYQAEFKKISDKLWLKSSGRELINPSFITEKLKNDTIQKELEKEVQGHILDLDEKLAQIIERKGREKWKPIFLEKWKLFKRKQLDDWRCQVNRNLVGMSSLFKSKVQDLRSEMRKRARDLVGEINFESDHSAPLFEKEFQVLVKKFADQFSNKDNPSLVDNNVMKKIYPELQVYFQNVLGGMKKIAIFWSSLQETLFKGLLETFEAEMLSLTFQRVKEQKWLYEIKWSQSHIKRYLTRATDVDQMAKLISFIAQPKEHFEIVLQGLIADIAKDLLCDGKGWCEFTDDVATGIERAACMSGASKEFSMRAFVEDLRLRLPEKLRESILLESTDFNLANEEDREFHKACHKKLISAINAQSGPSDLEAFSQRISELVIKQLLARNQLRATAVFGDDDKEKSVKITEENIKQLFLCSSEEDETIDLFDLKDLDKVQIARGLSQSELKDRLKEHCIHVTSNAGWRNLTTAESFVLSLAQHFTGRYSLECLDYSKLFFAHPNLDEARWNAFRIRLETYDFSSNVSPATLDAIIDQVRQLFSDCQRNLDQSAVQIVCLGIGLPTRNWTHCNGHVEKCTHTRPILFFEGTKRFEAIAPLRDVYEDVEYYWDALLKIYEAVIRSYFIKRFDDCLGDTEASEKLADEYREDIIKVGDKFESWDELFQRWDLADRLRTVTLNARRCRTQMAEEDLCEELRRIVAACFKSESEDAWDRLLKIRGEELRQVTEQSLESLEEIEQLQRELADLNEHISTVDYRVAATKEKLAWKKFLLKTTYSPAILADSQLVEEREKHKLFHEKNPAQLASKLFEYAYPEGEPEKRKIIESYVKRSDPNCLMNDLQQVLKLIIGQETKCSTHIGVLKVTGGLISVKSIKLPNEMKEIRIEAARAIHLDADLNIPGVSVSLSAPYIHSRKKRIINTSGNDAPVLTKRKADDGRGPGASGSHGVDGNNGQDAGHVAIKCLHFSGQMKVVANGGRGSRGQDGGHGKKGADGRNGEDAELCESRSLPAHVLFLSPWFGDSSLASRRIQGSKGTRGQDGGSGGNAGRGGRGGLAGHVKIDAPAGDGLIESEAAEGAGGEDGCPGQPGEGGSGGSDGRDTIVTRRRVARLSLWILVGTIYHYEYDWTRCSRTSDRQANGKRGREGERAAALARREASRTAGAQIGDDHWNNRDDALLAGIERERKALHETEEERRRLEALRQQRNAEMSGHRERLDLSEASRALLSQQMDRELEARRRLKEKNAEIPAERITVTARQNLRRQLKPDSAASTTSENADLTSDIRSGGNTSKWTDLIEAIKTSSKTRAQLERLTQELALRFGRSENHRWKNIESFVHKVINHKESLIDGLQLIVDCSRFSAKLPASYFDELLNVTEKLIQLNSARDFETFNWQSCGLASNPLSRLALDSRLFAIISQQLDERSKIGNGKLILMENVWPRGDFDVELTSLTRLTAPQDRSQWMKKVVRLLQALEQPVDSTVEQTINSLIRDRLGLLEDLSIVSDLSTAHGNRERLMLVIEHGALSLGELDAVARVAAKELDREMFSLAHFTFTEQFCNSKWREIMSLVSDRNQETVDLLAAFKRVIDSQYSVTSFEKRLSSMNQLIEKLRMDKSDSTKFLEWLQREIKILAPSIDIPAGETVTELVHQLKSARSDGALFQLLHQLDCVTLDPKQICELAGIFFSSSPDSNNEIIRLHWSSFKSDFTRNWFNYLFKFWNESHGRACPARKNGSVGSLEVLRAKFSLWTACLSPSVAADKWKRVEAAENYDDEVKLINLDLKPACKKIKEVISEQVNRLCKDLKIESDDIIKLTDACFKVQTKKESELVSIMELVQISLDLSQERQKSSEIITQDKIDQWKKKVCDVKESQPEFAITATQVINVLEKSTEDEDRIRLEACERIVSRRRQILDECAESMQWMAKFVHILSDPISRLNRLSLIKATIDQVEPWNWLDIKHRDQLLKSVVGVIRKIIGRKQQSSASSWNDVMDQIFDFFCSDKNDGSRVEIAASLADLVYDQIQQNPNEVDWMKVKKWVKQFTWLREMKHIDHFKKAHIKILLVLLGYCRLCYDVALAKDLGERNCKLPPHIIDYSFRSAFDRCKSCYLFLLKISCCNAEALDQWRLEMSAVQRTLEFFLRLAQSGRLLWDDATIDKELLKEIRDNADGLNRDGMSIVDRLLSETKQSSRRAFVERWLSQLPCSGTRESVALMTKAYCLNDQDYECDSKFFMIAGLDILTSEEKAYVRLIGNEELAKIVITPGTSPSGYLARLENLAVNRIKSGLRGCFQCTDVQYGRLTETLEACLNRKKKQSELIEWLTWLDKEVIPSLESYAENRGPTLKTVAAFLNDASRLPMDLGRRVTRRYRPHRWMSAIAFLSIERLLKEFWSEATEMRDNIVKKLAEWSTETNSEVVPGILRALYSKIIEKFDDPKQNVTVGNMLGDIVNNLTTIDSSKLDTRTLMRFSDSKLDDWPKVVRIAQLSTEWSPEIATRLVSLFPIGPETTNRSMKCLLDILPIKRDEAGHVLSKVLKNLFRYPWIKDELTSLAGLTDSAKQRKWLEKASDAKQIEQEMLESSRLDLTVDKILDALCQDPLSDKQLSMSSVKNCIKNSVNDVRNIYYSTTQSFTSEEILKWSLSVKEQQTNWSVEEFLAVACRAIELKKEYLPRDVQLVAVLAFVVPRNTKHINRQMAQISTGEGKTLITALIAIYHVLKHWNTKERRIDIITSSPVLAEANVAEIKWLYSAFEIEVTNNCDEKCSGNDNLKRERYNSDVIYGDLSNFMRDVLVTQYFDRDITRSTTAGAIVIDEVDSMLLDKGENVLYISHDLPEMYDLFALFVHIWSAVNAPHAPEPAEIEEFVRPRINGLVPRCLKNFSERHFSTWVASAWRARHVLLPNDAYKVDDVRDGRGAQIVIMDKETGVEQLRTEWSDGLQQFLQLKHGVKWTPPSLRAIYMSNMTYFTQFQGSMYGMTGTLGSKAECDLLSTLYGVEFFKLPRSKHRFCVQDEPVVVDTKQQWLDAIVRRVERVIRDKRAALVLCENIEAVNSVHHRLHRARITSESYVSSLDEKFKDRQQKDMIPGTVVIATNLAGRGTDLKLSSKLADNGGLHLIITFVPDNARVEDQAEGRTARAGQRGSYQFVVLQQQLLMISSTLDPYEQLFEMKETRDSNERQRLALLLDESVPKAILEERLFRRFFSECCQRPTSNPKWHISRQCLMNKWALWLDDQAGLIERASDPDVEAEVLQQFEGFVMDMNLKRSDPYQLAEIPSELIALAKSVDKEEAIRLCGKVAKTEPQWCENALIELSRLILAKEAKHPEKKEARKHLKLVRQLIEKRVDDLTGIAKIVSECLEKQKQENPDQETAFANTGFSNQANNLIGLWNIHSSAVDKLLGVPLERALASYFEEGHVAKILEFVSKSKMSYTKQEHYSRKVKISYCEVSKQRQLYVGENRVPWPPFLAHCREPLMNMIEMGICFNKCNIEREIADTEEKFWEMIVKEGFVSKNATSGPCYMLKQKSEIDFQTLPNQLKRLEKILADWFNSHEGEDLNLVRPALNLQDESEWELFVQWLKKKDLVHSHIRTKHRILQVIPSVSENPQAEICGSPLEQWAMVLSSWFSMGDEFVSKPYFKERAATLTKQYRGYFVDFGVIKPLKIAFSFSQRSRDKIQERLNDIRTEFQSLSDFDSLAHKMYDRDHAKSSEILINNLMASVNDHIGQLKAYEMVESSFTEIRETIKKPDDPIFQQRDECEEMESRHLDRVVKVEEKIPFDWSIVWIALIGVAQLIGAIAIPFLSSALIGEGINDLMYAFQCFQSPGSFSWKAYAKQKAGSMALTVLTLGIGAAKLVAASGNSFRNAARLIFRFNGTIKGWIQMGKTVVMRCVDAITSSIVGAAVSKFLNWLKKLLLEEVLERVKTIIFSFFAEPFKSMKELLKSLIVELVKSGKSVKDAVDKVKDLMSDDSTDETWLCTLKSKASSVVNGMLNIFEGSTGALQGLQSSFGGSFASKASRSNTGAITAAADGGTVAKAIKICSTIVDYGKEAMRVKEYVEKLDTANKLCTHASDRITSRNTRLQQELTRLKKERLSTAKEQSDDRQMTSDEKEKIDEFVSQVPGEMQTAIMQHVLDTIQSTWLEPKLQAYAQEKAAKLTSKIAVKVGLLPPHEKLSDSQAGREDETKRYEDMVDGIGEGDPAGPVEMQNAADALGINIKIEDATGEYTKGTDKDSFSFYSQGNPYSDANEVTLRFTTNDNGEKHFELIDKVGNVLTAGVPDPSQPPNRCLYHALGKAQGKTTDEIISACKNYAKTNERAKYMHDLGVDKAFGHLKAGATPRIPIIKETDTKDLMQKPSEKSKLGKELNNFINGIDSTRLQGAKTGTITQSENWRLDKQGEFQDRNNIRWANYQIQFGGDKNYQRKKGEKTSVALVLVPTSQMFSTEEFKNAFQRSSFGSKKIEMWRDPLK